MDGDDDVDVIAVDQGITVWYELQDPDECAVRSLPTSKLTLPARH